MKLFSNLVTPWLLAVVIVSSLRFGVQGESVRVVDLTSHWTLTNQKSTFTKSNLKIPSGVYSAFNGSEDVLFSYNDINRRWIANESWTYSNVFNVNQSEYKTRYANLTFHGIDTVAEIRLNGHVLGHTDNMFVRYSYDVSNLLEPENLLEIKIKSPVLEALARAKVGAPVPPQCPPGRYHGECHMNMLRKMQASFSWDWGLAAPSMGIWKSVSLEYYEAALLRDIDVIISRNVTHWNMHIKVYIDAPSHSDFYAELTFYAVELLKSAVIITDYIDRPISYKAPVISFLQAVPIENVKLWWPNGYGDQKLYPLYFTLQAWQNKDGPKLRSKTVSHKSIRVGFRTIELIEDPIERGNTFLFKVNGKEIFMKGTNYIPAHILPEHGSDVKRIKHLLTSAADAHMNMIRVWGGGVYESDAFYDLADSLGLLIWQDMMFACAMYPVTDDFLASVRKEVIQNAKRLAHHASVAIFAANNENEAALVGDWYGTGGNERFNAEYRELYLGTIIHELKVVSASSRPNPLSSSPSNGKEGEKFNYISPNPQDNNYGDVHFYSVGTDGWDPNLYPRPRFCSEYGFQSLPSLLSWQHSMAPTDDLLKLMDHRQHYPMGMAPIVSLVRRHLPLPLPEDKGYVEALIYFSQISQAMTVKAETELYRSLRDTKHRTMGALYWQLNDVWVAPSWSSIDFYGNYKVLQYWAKEFLAPITIIAHFDAKTKMVKTSLVCDLFEVDTKNLQVIANVYAWSDLQPRNTTSWPVTLKANGVHYDKIIPLEQLFDKQQITTKNSFVEFTLQRGTEALSRTYFFPSPIKSVEGMQDPKISVSISWNYVQNTKSSQFLHIFSLTVTVERPAVFVYIEVVHPQVLQYKLSRNGYMQLVGAQVVHLEFISDSSINLTRHNIQIQTVNQYMK